MLAAGAPVTPFLLAYIAELTHAHSDFLSPSTDSYRQLASFLKGDISFAPPHQPFMVIVSLLLALLDGGVWDTPITSVYRIPNGMSITWDSGVQHTIFPNEWNRATRNAIDYIGQHSIRIPISANPYAALRPIHAFLTHYHLDLQSQIPRHHSLDTATWSTNIFVWLSAMPGPLLDDFYIQVADRIPATYGLAGVNAFISAEAFFRRPTESMLDRLDKVKMHYNLHFHSQESLAFLDDLKQLTQHFVTQSLIDTTVRAHVQKELETVYTQQWAPQDQLLQAILSVSWPK